MKETLRIVEDKLKQTRRKLDEADEKGLTDEVSVRVGEITSLLLVRDYLKIRIKQKGE